MLPVTALYEVKESEWACQFNTYMLQVDWVVKEYLLHFQPWNTGFDPLNKSDIFTACYFHTVKISKVVLVIIFTVWKSQVKWLWRHVMYCMQCLRFDIIIIKHQRKCNNRKFNVFNFEYGINFTRETWFFKIFTLSLLPTRENIKNPVSWWNKFLIQRQTIEYPLFIKFNSSFIVLWYMYLKIICEDLYSQCSYKLFCKMYGFSVCFH